MKPFTPIVFALSCIATGDTGYADTLASFLSEVNHVIRSEEGRIAQQRAAESVEEPPAARAPAEPAVEREIPEVVYIQDLEVLATLRESLKKHYQLNGDLRITLLRPWKARPVSSHSWSVELVKVPNDQIEAVSVVRFRILDEGRFAGEHSVTLRCEHWLDVWHTTLPMERQQEVMATLLEPRRVDALSARRDLILASTDLSRYEFRQAVAGDRALTWRDLSVRPHVRRGDAVDVLIKQGAMEISMRGTALENGIAGDLITIRNTSSNKNFQARIVSESLVRVYL
ncbi:MAG: flagellar basal body P-ring formation chaperone FlgA [Verrucomicrobiota bacterium]